ncbi:MAG: hypothetical protein MJZ16_09085 [Bacteroidales bacterium]|nr:hypothetical protein [Bacteroidales bacterium]
MNQINGGSENLSKVENKENSWLNKAIIVAVVVIVIAAVALLLNRIPSPQPASTAADPESEVVNEDMNYSYLLDKLEGSYDVKFKTDGDVLSQGVARIKYNEIEGFDLIVYSEYRPVTYHFKADEQNKLHSDNLGEGTIKYEEEFDQITITFTKEDNTCELSR